MLFALLSLALAQPPNPERPAEPEPEIGKVLTCEFLRRIPRSNSYHGTFDGGCERVSHRKLHTELDEGPDGRPILKDRHPAASTLEGAFATPFREHAHPVPSVSVPDAHELSFNPEYGELPLAH